MATTGKNNHLIVTILVATAAGFFLAGDCHAEGKGKDSAPGQNKQSATPAPTSTPAPTGTPAPTSTPDASSTPSTSGHGGSEGHGKNAGKKCPLPDDYGLAGANSRTQKVQSPEKPPQLVAVCHNGKVLCVPAPAAAAHVGHGDTPLGPCNKSGNQGPCP